MIPNTQTSTGTLDFDISLQMLPLKDGPLGNVQLGEEPQWEQTVSFVLVRPMGLGEERPPHALPFITNYEW